MISFQKIPRALLTTTTGIVISAVCSIGMFTLGRMVGQMESDNNYQSQLRVSRSLLDCGGHTKKLYGHIHMAKTGGTTLNGMLANKFERVCGNKGYSVAAYHDNKKNAAMVSRGTTPRSTDGIMMDSSAPNMESIGYADCDYVSNEDGPFWWLKTFGDSNYHNIPMELHVPCRDPVDHLMSQCNMLGGYGDNRNNVPKIACDAGTDEEFFASIDTCLNPRWNGRFSHELEDHFDVKCFDFKKQFTTYIDYMQGILEDQRFEPEPYVKRETNIPRDKDSECIWKRPELMEKARQYLLEKVPYYVFCDECLGTENDLLL